MPTEAAYEQLVDTQFGALASQVLAHYPAANFPTPRAAYVRVTTDSRFVCPSRDIARAASHVQTEPVYRYFFQYPATPFGATHGIELPFVFDTFDSILVNGTPYHTDRRRARAQRGDPDRLDDVREDRRAGGNTDLAGVRRGDRSDADVRGDAVGETDGIRTADCDFWDNLH